MSAILASSALAGIQAVGALSKARKTRKDYEDSGLATAAERARAGLADPSKFGMSAAERRQMMGEAIRSSGNLANIQDPADYARQLAEQRASFGGRLAEISGERARDQYQDALSTVREDFEQRDALREARTDAITSGLNIPVTLLKEMVYDRTKEGMSQPVRDDLEQRQRERTADIQSRLDEEEEEEEKNAAAAASTEG
jgi:hypothetical protein